MRETTAKALSRAMSREGDPVEWLADISAMEQRIDDMTSAFRESHLERMRRGSCSEESCILFSELLTDFERIGDHTLNIAQAYSKIYTRKGNKI